MDLLEEKYYGISSYAYCMNDPVKNIDPDGKEILIHYMDKNGEDQVVRFRGVSLKVPKNKYVLDFIKAYNYNIRNGGGDNLKKAARDPNLHIDVSDTKYETDHYSPGTKFVYWGASLGTKTTEGGLQSPSTALEHEMDHAVDDAEHPKEHKQRTEQEPKDKNFDNAEEERVITGSETKTAKANKEAISRNHNGTYYNTLGPTTTKEKHEK